MKQLVAGRGFAVASAPADIRLALFHGPDESGSAELARQYMKRLTPDGDAVLSLPPALLKDDPGRLGDEAAAVSMFGNRLVIRVDGADDGCAEAFALLLDLPAAGNPVVATAGNLRKGSKLLTLAEAASGALVVISYEADARDAANAVTDAAAEFGLAPTREAAARLLDAATGDRGVIRQELAKLALYLDATPATPQPLTVDHLLAAGADIADDDFAPLVEAVASGRPSDADRQLRRLAAAGVNGIPLLRAVARRLFALLDLRGAVDGGLSPDSAIGAARPPVFWRDKPALAAQLGRWRTAALNNALDRLLAAERDIKAKGGAGDVLASQALLGIAVLASR